VSSIPSALFSSEDQHSSVTLHVPLMSSRNHFRYILDESMRTIDASIPCPTLHMGSPG
jgi:hypothetical protein